MTRRLAPAAAAIAVILAASSAGAQQLTVSGGLDPGTVVRTELEHLRFRTALPFDVQFFVRAPIDADVEEVQGKVARKRSSDTCEAVLQAIPTMPPMTSYRGPGIRIVPPRPVPGGAAAPVGTVPGTLPPATPAPPLPTPPRPLSKPGWLGYAALFVDNDLLPAPGRVFELSVPALKPRKDYCFAFVLRIGTDLQEARALVAQAVDTQLRGVADLSAITETRDYNAFRRQVIQALEDLRAAKERTKPFPLIIEVPVDSWFNKEATTTEIAERYRADFKAVFDAQLACTDTRTNVVDRTDDTAKAVHALQQDARFARMIAALREHASEELVAAHLETMGAALDLGTRSAQLVAVGVSSDGERPVALSSAWTAADIEPRVNQIDITIREVNSVANLAARLADNPALRDAAGLQAAPAGEAENPNALTPEALNAVARLAREARTSLREVRGELANLRDTLDDRTKAIATLAEQTAAAMERDVKFLGTTLTEWRTRATAYISADVGLAYSQAIDSFFFYLGTNFYLGPVNKKAPLSFREDGFRSSIRKRFAVMFGIPINGFDDTADISLSGAPGVPLQGVIGSRPLLVGGGFRVNDFVRLTGGSVFFKVPDPNPLISDTDTRHAAFFAISVDWDVRGMFGGLTGQTPASLSRR